MRKIISIVIILLKISLLNAQNNDKQLNYEQSIQAAKTLMEFDKQFDNGAPESLKKAKFNEFVNQLNPEMSKEDRDKAYTIVNWYIKASKGQKVDIHISEEQQTQLEQMLNQTKPQKETGIQAMYGKLAEVENISYTEYKNYITQNGEVPLLESDIQKAYNQMHQNDGKKVQVTTENTSKMTPNKAIEIVQYPKNHTYSEFKKALKLLKPEITDEKIKEIWNKLH